MKCTVFVAGIVLLCSTLLYGGEITPHMAQADLSTAQGEPVGFVTLTEGSEGVKIVVHGYNLPPGLHAFHIHETGKCDAPDFKSAGGHFAPYGHEHGFKNPKGPHAGDLPNLLVDQDGTATAITLAPLVTFESGKKNSLFKDDGTAFIIHQGPDDYVSQPAGDAGERIACGVITKFERR